MSKQWSGWAVGYTVFAAVMMWLVGGMHLIAGFAALINDEFYVLGQEYVFKFDLTTWGWIHLLIGTLVVIGGIALFGGAVWARTLAVILTIASVLTAFAWLPWYPVFGAIIIAVGIGVIWAVTAHGRDIAAS
jgi:hypothetical protein